MATGEELGKHYQPKEIEQRLYEFWEKGEFFTPLLDGERPKFSIVIPPPNVTGRLHIGHALVNTLQDILVRWKRMSGFNTLWLAGTDDDGLIYRGIAIVNWCPHCRTAISDVEVEYVERASKLYYIDYPVIDSDRLLTIATTRPETMLGDTALAVHPDDERYKDVIGREATLPIANRRIPIVADPILVDPTFGTGVVKVTPAHDKNDYEAGKRNDLQQLQVIDDTGKMNEAAGPEFAGLDRFEARKKIVEMLRESGALREVKDYTHSIGIHGKCETVIEPMISRQWFVKIEPLAKPATDALRNGTPRIRPQRRQATYCT